MKTYKQIMEVMSMSDMNKITGGDEAQRKLAQERQRKREAKAKGFDPNKSVLADGSKPSEEVKKEPTKTPDSSAIKKSSAIVKPSALTKTPDRKPAVRKSELGKWSQGIKQSPGKLAKKEPSAIEPKVKKVKVTDDSREGQRSNRPGTTRPKPQQVQQSQEVKRREEEKKKKKKKGPSIFDRAKNLAKSGKYTEHGVATSGNLDGPEVGRDKGSVG